MTYNIMLPYYNSVKGDMMISEFSLNLLVRNLRVSIPNMPEYLMDS